MSNPRLAMFPGTFDPPTYGHIDIIKRSARLFETLDVVIADNIRKKTLFTSEERREMLATLLKDEGNVRVCVWNGLVAEYAREKGIGVMIRGVRALADFNFEFELALCNKHINKDVEVLFMPTSPEYFTLRSSSIREMVSYGVSAEGLVPPLVERALARKRRERGEKPPVS